jgi:ubiquitin-conjugating enzyme E2 S
VETLKRDWDSKLTLKDVLVTISCLLIQPNPDSALNEDAGVLFRQSYDVFAERARMMTGIHAGVPKDMEEIVREAQMRGQEEEEVVHERREEVGMEVPRAPPEAPARRRRTIARVRSTMAARTRSDGSPTGLPSSRAQPSIQTLSTEQDRPFVFQSARDDVFGGATTPPPPPRQNNDNTLSTVSEDDSTMDDPDQENDATRSPTKFSTSPLPHARTPRRPQGAAVPLGELTLEDTEPDTDNDDTNGGGDTTEEDEDMEPEYPPSPRKSSPRKTPALARQKYRPGRAHGSPGAEADSGGAESSVRHALFRAPPRMEHAGQRTLGAWASEEEEEDSAMMDVTMEEPDSAARILRRGGAAAGGAGLGLSLGLFNTPPKRSPGRRAAWPQEEAGTTVFMPRQPITPSPPSTPLEAHTPSIFFPATANGKAKITNGQVSAKALAKVVKPMSSTEKKAVEKQRRKELDERLWRACGGDIGRWNRGEFDTGLEGVGVVVRGHRW